MRQRVLTAITEAERNASGNSPALSSVSLNQRFLGLIRSSTTIIRTPSAVATSGTRNQKPRIRARYLVWPSIPREALTPRIAPVSALESERGTLKNSPPRKTSSDRSEEHTSELQSHHDLVCRLLL